MEFKQSIYERACNFADRIITVKPSKSLEAKLSDAIEFTRLNVKTSGPFSLGFLMIILSLAISIPLIFLIHSFGYVIFFNLIVLFFAFYVINYPIHLKKVFRIKAGSEIVLSILYMVISMRSTPNLENAVVFASSNLPGIVGRDLKKLIWDIQNRKYDDVGLALRAYANKWKEENQEYLKSIELIIESLYQTEVKRNRVLDEAVNVILVGSSERMNRYARELLLPVSAIYMMGIMLPVLGMVMFPMLGIFLGEFVTQWHLVLGYNIILPIFVFWFIMNSLEARPMTFSEVDISEHPETANADKFSFKFGKLKILIESFIVALVIETLIVILAIILLPIPLTHSLVSVAISSLFVIAIATGIILYSYGKSHNLKKIQDEVETIETEFNEAIFQLGYRVNRGVPLEKALGETVEELKGFKIRDLFERILTNIKNLGMTFENALIDKTYGAVRYYPSRLIKAVMKVISDSSKKGTLVAANAMLVINQYLKGIHNTQEKIDDTLSETLSSLNFLAYFLVPMMCGIVVALSQLIINILMSLAQKMDELTKISGLSGFNPIESMVNLQTATTPEMMQMIIGIYMVELSVIMAYFISGVRKGISEIDIQHSTVRVLLVSTIIYIITMIVVGAMFEGVVKLILSGV